MIYYEFQCPKCALQFNVVRKEQTTEPAFCPVDGRRSRQLLVSTEPIQRATPAPEPVEGGIYHFGHYHPPGTPDHAEGDLPSAGSWKWAEEASD